jgi:uncharacterized membrane protein HdeD (DUF308 family)
MSRPDDSGFDHGRPHIEVIAVTGHDLGHAIARLRRRWPWLVAFGVATALLGLAALGLTTAATFASVYMIAFFMILVGGWEIALGVDSPHGNHRFLRIVVGLLYLVAAAFVIANPLSGAAGFTLMLGAALGATGLTRIFLGMGLPDGPRAPVVVAGVVTTLLGMMILFGWPENAGVVLGIFLGVDLLFYGASWTAFGLVLRGRERDIRA